MDPRHSGAYAQLRAALRAEWTAADAPCWICAQPIEYAAPIGDPTGLDLDHVKNVKAFPHLALDPANCRPSHVRCNRSRGSRAPRPVLGITDEEW